MKKILFIFSFIILATFQTLAQKPISSAGSARTMTNDHIIFALFEPTRFPLFSDIELDLHPYLFPVLPQVAVKKIWFHDSKLFTFSTYHAITFPRILFPIDSMKIFGARFSSPTKYAIQNEILVSRIMKKATSCTPPNLLLTLKLGFEAGGNPLPMIDFPLVLDSSKVYRSSFVYYIGADLNGFIDEKFNFYADINVLSNSLPYKNLGVEQKTMLVYPVKNFIFAAGYKLMYEKNATGKKLLVLPLFDVYYKLVRTVKDDHRLFDRKMEKQ